MPAEERTDPDDGVALTFEEAGGGENAVLDLNSMFKEVQGKVVLLTGGGSGIGARIASGFVQKGAKVYIASRKDNSAYASSLTSKGPGTCVALKADIQKVADQKSLLQAIGKAEGKLHVLVNNSGTTFDRACRTVAILGLSRLAIPLFEQAASLADPGRVINISSIFASGVPSMDNFAYTSSKAAVLMLSKHLALELADQHITVNSICPPIMSRPMRETVGSNAGQAVVASIASAVFLSSRSFLPVTDFARLMHRSISS